MKFRITTAITLLFCLLSPALAELKMPAIFADDMVLQRGIALPVWGTAKVGETVQVTFAGQTKTAATDADGKWRVALDPLVVLSEPATFTVTDEDGGQLTMTNVLVGDVWVCSGQSNMQFPVQSAINAQNEIAAANLPGIRLFFMPNVTAVSPQSDCAGKWRVCSPDTVRSFTAVGFFFGRHLHRELNVPIGLIGTSWGGTVAEAWTSASALHANLPEFDEDIANMLVSDVPIAQAMTMQETVKVAFEQARKELFRLEEDLTTATATRAAVDWDDAAWGKMSLPGNWEDRGLKDLDGIVWFRKTLEIPAAWAGKDIVLRPGAIDEVDVTWFNGQLVGARGNSRKQEVEFWNVPRVYPVPGELVKAGVNIVAIRVSDLAGQGGLWGTPAAEMNVALADGSDATVVPLAGDWRYDVELTMPPRPQNFDSPNRPAVLFNAMINPIIPFGITGAIWYQGESNAGRSKQYRTLLPTLIGDWRERWGQGDFTFLIVQLANFMKQQELPGNSQWAELREAQTMTVAADPKVGQALAIDIGDAMDIHPKNKQEVGRRLGLAAQAIAYGQVLPFSGPLFDTMSVADGKATLAFTHTDGGLIAKDGQLTGFAVAGADKRFVWAEARIEGDKVVVGSPDVPEPVAVRYAWADNPACNFYNGAGLPAVPFRTDGE